VPMEGWRRADFYDATGLRWVNPSPNLRTLAAALLYPGIGLLETTNVSVGRGTDTPFETLGAPWIDDLALARRLNACGLPGVRFLPVVFTPASSTFQGERCGGVSILVTDRGALRPVSTGLELARQLRLLYPNAWDTSAYGRLLGNERTLEAVLTCTPVDAIEAMNQPELDEFLERRSRFLLYP